MNYGPLGGDLPESPAGNLGQPNGSVTRDTPWPFGPKSLQGMPVRDWPMTHVLSQLHMAYAFPEAVAEDKAAWIEVLATEAETRTAAGRDADLRLMPDGIDDQEDWPV